MKKKKKERETNSLLIIAFQFPPVQGGSGVHRITSWCKYLSQMGWEITVLTVKPNAHVRIRKENFKQIPKGIRVIQAPAIDAARHLSIWKRYPGWAAIPDRWQSWIASGLFAGIHHVRKYKPDLILSSAPIPSAHAIALGLKKIFGLPWVADFRDPMTGVAQETSHVEKLSRQWVEKQVFNHADHITVTTPGTFDLYKKKYGAPRAETISIVENGFDPETFDRKTDKQNPNDLPENHPLIFVHSGLVYSNGRNPKHLFNALARLKSQGRISEKDLCFLFRASGFSDTYHQDYKELSLGNLVRFEDQSLSHEDAISEMENSHALVLFQGSVFNAQIPAKAYEYIALKKPILAMVDPKGDTAKMLHGMDTATILDMNDPDMIYETLPKFIEKLTNNQIPAPDDDLVQSFSRKSRTMELDRILKSLLTPPNQLVHQKG